MKTKHSVNKLVLNKETVAHLESSEMLVVKGGTLYTYEILRLSNCVCLKTITCDCPITQ